MIIDEKNCLIVLAAGHSKRMGHPKGLLKYNEANFWLEQQIKSFASLGGRSVVIVLGDDLTKYCEEIPWLQGCRTGFCSSPVANNVVVKVIHNRSVEKGQFHSIILAAQFLNKHTPMIDRAMILPVDVPLASSEAIKQLLSGLGDYGAVPRYRDSGGHPVILTSNGIKTLLAESDSGKYDRLDHWLFDKVQVKKVKTVKVRDELIIKNLNYMENWQTFIK